MMETLFNNFQFSAGLGWPQGDHTLFIMMSMQYLMRSRTSQAFFNAMLRPCPASVQILVATAGARHVLNASGLPRAASSSRLPPPPVEKATAQSTLGQGMKMGEEKRPVWPYLKAAKQQFFNVVLASLAIAMALKMLDGKGKRIALQERIDELERREGVLMRALADEQWAEDAAKRIGITGGKKALLSELDEVIKRSMLDKESAQLEDMRSNALKASKGSSLSTTSASKDMM